MTTHLDILIKLLHRAHDTDCPLYNKKVDSLDFCSCEVRPEVRRLEQGLVPWAEVENERH